MSYFILQRNCLFIRGHSFGIPCVCVFLGENMYFHCLEYLSFFSISLTRLTHRGENLKTFVTRGHSCGLSINTRYSLRKKISIIIITVYYCNHGFLAVSLHISIILYIRTSHSTGNASSFKTQALGAFKKSALIFVVRDVSINIWGQSQQ